MMDAKDHLTASNAGMRLIALLTLFNQGDFPRLRQYVNDNYQPEALELAPVGARAAEMKAIYRYAGKMRVEQVMAIGKHQAVVVLASEKRGAYLAEITVSEEYPHKVLAYILQPVKST